MTMAAVFAWGRRGLLAVALIVGAAWAVTSLSFPFGWDHGLLANVGDTVLSGGMPYRDAWDIKGPLAHLWFALAQFLFGRRPIGIRILDLALLLWATMVLARTGARLTRRSAAAWIGIGLVLCYGSLTYFFTAQPDGAVALALVLGISPLMSESVKPRQIAIAGFIVGLAVLVKPIYLVFLVLPLWATSHVFEEASRRLRLGALAAAAAAVPVVVMIGWFAVRGALADLVDVHIRYAAVYSGVSSLGGRTQLMSLLEYFWSGARAPALAFVVFGFAVAWRRKPGGPLLCGWLLCGLATVIIQAKYFVYHWIVVFPPATLLAAFAIDELLKTDAPVSSSAAPAGARYRVLAYAGVACMLVPLIVQPATDVGNLIRFISGRDTAAQYYARFGYPGDPFSAGDDMAAADYIRSHTSDRDHIAILGYDAPTVFLSGRPNATRFSYALPLVGWRSSQAVRSRYQQEFMLKMNTPPVYVIVGVLFPDKQKALALFPDFVTFLDRQYVLEKSFGEIDLYRLRQ